MLEFQMVVSRWLSVVSQSISRQLLFFGQRPFLACLERSEGTNDQRRSTASCSIEDQF
jgi:hypothetical protein